MGFLIGLLATGVGLLGLLIWAIEYQYRRRPGNKLELTAGTWKIVEQTPQRILLVGVMDFINRTQRLEVMVPEISAKVKLLSSGSLDRISTHTRITPKFKDGKVRPDGYWEGHIVKIGTVDPIEVVVEITGDQLQDASVAWIKVNYVTYGPGGRIPKTQHAIVPLRYPAVADSRNWRSVNGAEVLPIRTHLLTHLDNPVDVVNRYVKPHAKSGDIVAIAESPIAIMQARFRHPADVKPGWVATRLCYQFLPTSSLATACGLQTLVDIVGPGRVFFASVAGAFMKLVLRQNGWFYRLAGEQARLIDDVTGTIPPYDQFIVMGPQNPEQVVEWMARETGIPAAIVDVNDLKRVKVLAASSGVSLSLLEQALIKNPAGNADEQTPVVLIRPQ